MRSLPPLAAALVLAAGAPAAAQMFFAAGFSGAFTRAVALDPEDSVVGCRATARMEDGRALTLEKWRDEPTPRLWLQSDSPVDIHLGGYAVLADGRQFPLPRVSDPDPFARRLSPEARDALLQAEDAAITVHDYRVRLPRGLSEALRFVADCAS